MNGNARPAGVSGLRAGACSIGPALAGIALLALLLGAPRAVAFPPSPHYTVFGLVRDQVGTVLQVVGAEIVLLRDNVELGRAPITTHAATGMNYELRIPIDQARPASRMHMSLSSLRP